MPVHRQAEAQLRAAAANVGIAVAHFYPDVSLTGNLDVRAIDVFYITRQASPHYSAASSISLPIFQGRQVTANLRLARAQAAEAPPRYRGTVLNALRETEGALVSFRADRIGRDRQADVLRSGQQTLALAASRYSRGFGLPAS